jgi:ribosomal protein S18 acetylase RimI-like enzyme
MLTIRPARWPDDLALLADLDNAFTTDRIYRVSREEFGFSVTEQVLESPLHKMYGPVPHLEPRIQQADFTIVSEQEGRLVGVAAVKYETWNRRAEVWHVYVAKAARRGGVGAALLNEVEAFARAAGARCLWVETQNVNFPAIQFYRRAGFQLCGLDESLYEPEGCSRDEVALFFARPII